jgi:uncharacterized metal-binding protein YceD (DUF177 family)
MTPEFSRPERLDQIGGEPRTVRIEADAAERTALARRFGLLAIDRLTAEFQLRRETGGVRACGRVEGAVTQACAVTGEPLPASIDEAVDLRFAEDTVAAEEVELSADALDTLPIEGGAIDLGEAAAETLALALDPFPRAPGAADALAAAGVLSEGEGGPFGALAALKEKLTR